MTHPQLTDLEKAALSAFPTSGFADEPGYLSFAHVERNCNLDRGLVRRVVRALARKGVVKYGKGLWTEDGRVGGAGYALTSLGVEMVENEP